jgi:hypothetical protein
MDHQSLLTCPIWKLIACCRAVVDSSRIFSRYRDCAGLLRVRELPIDHTAIHGWVQRKELPLWQIQ